MFNSVPAGAQDEDHPTVVVSSYLDFKVAFKDFATDGYGVTAEYLLGSDWGIALEYSKLRLTDTRSEPGSLTWQGSVTSPAIFLFLHASFNNRVGVIAALGVGSSRVQYSSEGSRYFVFKDEKTYTYPQVKLGVRVKILDPVHVFANVSWYHLASAGVAVAL